MIALFKGDLVGSFKKVSKFSLSITKFKLFQGGCLSTLLPRELCKKHCCVSIKNIPKTSVSFTVLLLLCVKILRISIGRVSNMIKLLNYYHSTTWKVCGYDKIPYPYYISEFVKKLYHVNVLLHNNHYYLIRNMSTFASGEKSNRRKCYVCQYCLCYFVKKERYDLHEELCVKGGHQYEFPHKCKAQPCHALLGYPFHNTAAHTEAMPTREGI